MTIWDEIQAAVRGPHAIPRGESELVTVRRLVVPDGRRWPVGCLLCGCPHDEHSTILPFSPCLNCGDCIGWTVAPPPPNPARRERL